MYEINVVKIENALKVVEQLEGIQFARSDENWKTTGGLKVMDVQRVLPNALRTDGNGTSEVNYDYIVGVLIEAVKDLHAEITELKSQRSTLRLPKK